MINELVTALSKAQGEMQAAIKSRTNPFYKSTYADLGSVWDAARPVLSKYGLCIMQTTEIQPDNKIVMITTLAHLSGQWVKSYLPLNPSKNDNQGIGAAITYLRRYSLSAIVGVVCDDDDDGEMDAGRGKTQNNYHQRNTSSQSYKSVPAIQIQEPEPESIGEAEVVSLQDLINNLDEDSIKAFQEWIKKSFKVDTIQQIPKKFFGNCVALLNAKIKYLRDIKEKERAVA